MDTPVIGKSIKVWLPGETPWAEVIATNEDGTFLAKIANTLLPEMSQVERAIYCGCPGVNIPTTKHKFKFGDLIRFMKDPEYNVYIPVTTFASDTGKASA